MTDFLHHSSRLDLADKALADFDVLKASFESLEPSNYKDGSYRLRRYSRFCFDKNTNTITLQPQVAFVQDDSLNQFQGNVARTYDDLTAKTYNSLSFAKILQIFADTTDLPAQSLIEVHQMRLLAKGADSITTPEGIHQDGFDYVGVFTVARYNATGGKLLLWQDKTDNTPIASQDAQAGDFCIVNDKVLWHSATNLHTIDDGIGYWDIFVLTAHNTPFEQAC